MDKCHIFYTMNRTPTLKTVRQQTKLGTPTTKAPINSFQRSLKEREENLRHQRQKLDLAWKKLREDMKDLEDEKKRNEELQTEMRLWEDIRGNVNEETVTDGTILKKALQELYQHQNIVKKGLFMYEKKKEILLRSNPEIDPILEGEIQDKQQLLEKIEQTIDYINTDLIKRETETMELEEQAKEHQIAILEAEDRHKELLRQKIAAQSEKNLLLKKLDELRKQNETIQANIAAANERMEKAKEEDKMLDEEEAKLKEEENNLQIKKEKLEKLREKFENLKKERSELEMEKRRKEDEKLKQVVLKPIEDKNIQESVETLMIDLEMKKSDLSQREMMLNLEENRIADDFNAQKKGLEDAINYLQESIKNKAEESEKAANNQQKVDEITKEIEEKQKQIENLKSQLKSDEEIKKMQDSLEADKKEVEDMEKELSEVLAKLQNEEDDVDREEEELKLQIEKAKNEQILLEEKEKHLSSQIEIYEKDIENSQERLESLTNSLQKQAESLV